MLKVYNTITKKKEIFKPLKKNKVGMYVCGPTVYGPSHLGHARTYAAFDIIRRYLEHSGFKVKLVVNITDIHDDMIAKAIAEKTTIFELAGRYIPLFLNDLARLNVEKAFKYPRVTEHIPEIIKTIKLLEKNGFTYRQDHSVYFRIAKFKDYGRLSGVKLSEEISGTRVETDKYEKENPSDFVLWKEMKKGEPYWQSPWGAGRPGWHIECSAMAAKYLGKQFDIHGGAVDLIFPHHENEIAQSEAAFGKKPFVKYFLHTGPLTVGGVKMSRSLGNYIEVKDLLEKTNPLVLRYFFASVHYRSPVDFSERAMEAAESALEKIQNFAGELIEKTENAEKKKTAGAAPKVSKLITKAKKDFQKEMDEDFNTPRALAVVFDLIKNTRKSRADGTEISGADAAKILKFMEEFNDVFGVLRFEKPKAVPPQILKMAEERTKARAAGKWAAADELRKKIEAAGFKIEDTPRGPMIKALTR